MPRPRMRRWVTGVPKATYFKPQGIPLHELAEVRLSVEGLEALRLADLEGLTAEAAAGGMGVSRHTFGRVLAEARACVARALVEGAALRIEGGHYEVAAQADGGESAESAAGRWLAVPSRGAGLEALVEPRWERAAGFVLVDPGDGTVGYCDRGRPAGCGRGAGRHALRRLREAGVAVVVADATCPGLVAAAARFGLRVSALPPGPEGETVGQLVNRLPAGDG